MKADISRIKWVIGDGLRFRNDRRRATEVAVAMDALNRMLELRSPEYVLLGACCTIAFGNVVMTCFGAFRC